MYKLIIANWKMNPQKISDAGKLFNSIKNWVKQHSDICKNVKIIICPPFVYLERLSKSLKFQNSQLKLKLGAQNLFWEEKGAFTGEISSKMLKNLGVEYVIVGHSERRRILGETDEMINKKLQAAIKEKLKPILCIGETIEERNEGKTFRVLRNQIIKALSGFIKQPLKHPINQLLKKIIIAYEPVWAIGSGNPCEPEDAKKILVFLKSITQSLSSSFTQFPILYGGSVNSKNAKNYIEIGFDGLLIGGSSLNPKEFRLILESLSNL